MKTADMDERPGGAELLLQARRELREITAEEPVGDSHNYRARLIAKAMAIAARELERGPVWRAPLASTLARLLEGSEASAAPDDLAAMEARLGSEIRQGRRNGDPTTYAWLLEGNAARVQVIVGEAGRPNEVAQGPRRAKKP